MTIFNFVLLVFIIINYVNGDDCETETETLCVNQVNEDGFGDPDNQYSWSMATFKGSVYIGTLNAEGGLGQMALFFLGQPFDTTGAQVWKGDRKSDGSWEWTQVLKDGLTDKDNYGIRSFEVVDDYLYGVTANHVSGFELWRTKDGEDWEAVMEDGFGADENTSGRGLTVFEPEKNEKYLYIGGENRRSGAKMWRRELKSNGDFAKNSDWEEIVTDGLGYISNFWFSDFAEFNGYLYTGTMNVANGMQLWRTKDGKEFEMIFDEGNGDRFESAVMKLCVYNNKLYFGTMNFESGAGLYVNEDDNGKEFEAIFTDGNGNRLNAYVWQLKEYMGRLYIGTFKMFGEFDLYSYATDSTGGPLDDKVVVETEDAFSNEYHYGIRSFAIFEDSLMIGSATSKDDPATKVFETVLLPEKALDFASAPDINYPALVNNDGTITYQVALVIFCFSLFFLSIGIWIGKRGNGLSRSKQIDL